MSTCIKQTYLDRHIKLKGRDRSIPPAADILLCHPWFHTFSSFIFVGVVTSSSSASECVLPSYLLSSSLFSDSSPPSWFSLTEAGRENSAGERNKPCFLQLHQTKSKDRTVSLGQPYIPYHYKDLKCATFSWGTSHRFRTFNVHKSPLKCDFNFELCSPFPRLLELYFFYTARISLFSGHGTISHLLCTLCNNQHMRHWTIYVKLLH